MTDPLKRACFAVQKRAAVVKREKTHIEEIHGLGRCSSVHRGHRGLRRVPDSGGGIEAGATDDVIVLRPEEGGDRVLLEGVLHLGDRDATARGAALYDFTVGAVRQLLAICTRPPLS